MITNTTNNNSNNTIIITKPLMNVVSKSWRKIFNLIDKDIFDITEELYNEFIQTNNNVFPIYENIFRFSYFLSPIDIKVCIIGQDPYHGIYKDPETSIYYPEATGLSFMVDKKCHIPSSLQNIFKNLKKFNQILFEPAHGDLSFWAYQGVLLLNSYLTVKKSIQNSCKDIWSEFTDELLKHISTKYKNIVFILWGKHAYLKKESGVIKNQQNHKFIISSHPSG